MPPDSKQALTVYLLKSEKELAETIPDHELLNHQSFRVGDQLYDLYSKESFPLTPRWATFFPEDVDLDQLGKSSSPGAVLLAKVGGNSFALTFGTGRYLLDEGASEESFGLRVVLNSVDKVRSIDKNSFDAINGKTRTQASKEFSIMQFGIDVERDLLKAVTGRPRDEWLGVRISGIDSLHVSPPIEIQGLPEFLAKIHERSLLTEYRNGEFAFVDRIRSISEKSLIAALDEQLVKTLKGDEDGHRDIELILPDIVDFSNIDFFRYEHRPRKPENLRLIHLKSFLEAVRRLKWEISIETLKNKVVYATHPDGSTTKMGKIYRCLLAEMDLEGQQYVLSDGKWYEINSDYLAKVNKFYDDASRYPVQLPIFGEGISRSKYDEGDYNEDVAANDKNYRCFDKKLLHPESGQKFEFCDLYGFKNGFDDILHVKIGKSSAALSHMFAQGLISAETFKEFPEVRKELNKKLFKPNGIAELRHKDEIDSSKYRIVYAVVRKKGLPLPFFSRVNLRQAFRALRKWGYAPFLAEIDIDHVWSMTKDVTRKTISLE